MPTFYWIAYWLFLKFTWLSIPDLAAFPFPRHPGNIVVSSVLEGVPLCWFSTSETSNFFISKLLRFQSLVEHLNLFHN